MKQEIMQSDVLIVGAGISGLASAHFLKKQGLNSIIVEKEKRCGGSIRSEKKDGFLVEYGPNSSLDTSPDIHELFSDAGVENEMVYANDSSKNRYIVRYGKLNPLPMGLLPFLKTRLFTTGAKLRLMKEPFIAAADKNLEETLAQFVERRLGPEFLHYAIDPFVAGVYAGLPDQLSVQAGFPKLYALEEKYGSLIKGTIMGARERKKSGETSKQSARLFSFKNGMDTMITAIAKKYEDNIYLQSQIMDIQKNEAGYLVKIKQQEQPREFQVKSILLTIPVFGYRKFEFPFFESLKSEFDKIYYPPVAMLFFGYRQNPGGVPLDGFGYLVPKKENKNILGTIWSSTIFDNRAPKGGIALTTFVGGSRQPQNARLSDEELQKLARKDLADLMGIQSAPDYVAIQRWEKAIPQYNLGHLQIIEEIEKFENSHPGVYLSGNFRGGIAVGDCIKNAKLMAERIQKNNQ